MFSADAAVSAESARRMEKRRRRVQAEWAGCARSAGLAARPAASRLSARAGSPPTGRCPNRFARRPVLGTLRVDRRLRWGLGDRLPEAQLHRCRRSPLTRSAADVRRARRLARLAAPWLVSSAASWSGSFKMSSLSCCVRRWCVLLCLSLCVCAVCIACALLWVGFVRLFLADARPAAEQAGRDDPFPRVRCVSKLAPFSVSFGLLGDLLAPGVTHTHTARNSQRRLCDSHLGPYRRLAAGWDKGRRGAALGVEAKKRRQAGSAGSGEIQIFAVLKFRRIWASFRRSPLTCEPGQSPPTFHQTSIAFSSPPRPAALASSAASSADPLTSLRSTASRIHLWLA